MANWHGLSYLPPYSWPIIGIVATIKMHYLPKAAYSANLLLLCCRLFCCSKVIRNYWEYTAIALWLSTFMSLGLAYFVKHKSLNIEAKILLG